MYIRSEWISICIKSHVNAKQAMRKTLGKYYPIFLSFLKSLTRKIKQKVKGKCASYTKTIFRYDPETYKVRQILQFMFMGSICFKGIRMILWIYVHACERLDIRQFKLKKKKPSANLGPHRSLIIVWQNHLRAIIRMQAFR